MTTSDPFSEEKPELAEQIPLIWRIVAVVFALAIIGVLLYPRFSRQTEPVVEQAVDQNVPAPVEGDQASPEALFTQGQDHYRAGRWNEAISTYRQVIELDPTHQSAYVNLGDAYYQNSQLDLAVEAYLKAVELDPDDADAAYNLGAAYLQQAVAGQTVDQVGMEKAIAQIERATQLNPQLPHPHYALAEAYRLLGKNDQAIQSFEKFLELDDGTDSQATSTAQQRLQQLKAAADQ